MFGLPRRYHIDTDEIDRAWRAISRKVHPDRFVARPAVERRMSLQWTASLNEARRALRDPIRRAWFLATGVPNPPERSGGLLDPDFLEEVFELQAQASTDPEAGRARADVIHAALMGSLEEIFRRWEAGEGSLDAVEGCLARLGMLSRTRAQL